MVDSKVQDTKQLEWAALYQEALKQPGVADVLEAITLQQEWLETESQLRFTYESHYLDSTTPWRWYKEDNTEPVNSEYGTVYLDSDEVQCLSALLQRIEKRLENEELESIAQRAVAQ